MKYLSLFFIFFLFFNFSVAQKIDLIQYKSIFNEVNGSLDQREIDFLSAYVYVLNGNNIKTLFDPTKYSNRERELYGIKKGYETQNFFLNLRTPITNTIPLFSYVKVQKDKEVQIDKLYKATIFTDLPAKGIVLGSGIDATLSLNVAINNKSAEFWQTIFSYTTELLSLSLDNPIESVSKIIVGAHHKMDELKNTHSVNISWNVQLVTPLSDFTDNIYQVSIYEIAWQDKFINNNKITASFPTTLDSLSNLLEEKLSNSGIYVASVITYKKYDTNHANLSLDKEYLERSKSNFNKYLDDNTFQKSYENKFLDAFKDLLEAKDDLKAYIQNPVKDFNLIRAVKYYYSYTEKRKNFIHFQEMMIITLTT